MVYTVASLNSSYHLGVGSVNPNARVNNFGINVFDPIAAFGDSTGNTAWQSYGGNDVNNTPASFSRMNNNFAATQLTFKYGTLNPGEVKQFTFVHLAKDAYEVAALNDISVPVLTQPTDIASGSNMLFSALSTQFAILQCTFSVFAVSSGVWHTLGAVSYATSLNAIVCSLYADTTVLPDGNAQLSVSMTTTGGVFQAQKAIVLSNSGPLSCFSTSDLGGKYAFTTGADTPLSVYTCSGSGTTSVSFYREYYYNNEVVSTLLYTATGSHYVATVTVADLAVGTAVSIKAVTSSSLALPTTTVFTGVVTTGPPADTCVCKCYSDCA